MTEPSEDEVAGWRTVADLLTWAELEGDPADPSTAAGSWLRTLGAPPSAHWRALGHMPEDLVNGVLAAWQVGDPAAPPSAFQRAQAGLAMRAARIGVGTQLRRDVIANNAQSPLYVQIKSAEAPAVAAASGAPKPTGATFKMTDVIDQYGPEDELAADESGLEQGYLAYSKVFGDLPPEAEDISVEQWCGVRALLASSRLYVDFATFGPYSSRT